MKKFLSYVTIGASVLALGACSGKTDSSQIISPQQKQEMNQRIDDANHKLQIWHLCTKGPIEQYSQCMVDHGVSPDGSE